jgi:hypothetical protein
MSLAYPNAAVFAGAWCVLAAWQSYRAFDRCQATSGWIDVFWILLALFLAAPLVVVGRLRGLPASAPGRQNVDVTLAIVVLAYVPILLSMHLLELCGATR